MRLMSVRAMAAGIMGLLLSSYVQAAPALVVLEDNGSDNTVYREVIENLGAMIVANNLGRIYDHIDILKGRDATRENLFAQIRKRSMRREVDVVILTRGLNGHLALRMGDISEQDVRAAGPFPRLRLVYMMACNSASMQQAWLDSGARTVVGHQDVNSLAGFFFPRFLRRWSEGATARVAAEEAYRFAERTSVSLAGYIKPDNDFLTSVGAVRSEPVLSGVDMDRFGHIYPERALAISGLVAGADDSRMASPAGIPPGGYRHSDFARLSLSLLGAMLPQTSLQVEAIPSPQKLVDRISGVAWDQLRDSFPSPAMRSGGDIIPGLDLPTKDGEEIWIDGEALRYILGTLTGYAGEKLAPVLEHIQGLRLTRQGDALNAALYFDHSFNVPLQDESKIRSWQPYAVYSPKTVRFEIRMLDGVLMLLGLDRGLDAVNLKLKMPFLPDSVWVRSVSVDMDKGKVLVEAGVIHNMIAVIAHAQIAARKFAGVDVWDSIKKNLSLLVWPVLLFERK